MADKSGSSSNGPLDDDDILFGGDGIIDYDETPDVDEEEARKERAAALQKKLIIGGVSAVLIIIIILAYLAFFKKEKEEEKKVPDTKPVSLQLVNRQQVEWANMMCAHSAFWAPKMKNKVVASGVVTPVKGRDAAVRVLENNAEIARKMNEQVEKTPQTVFDTSVKEHRIPSVTLIEKKDGEEPDQKNVENTKTVSIAIDTYANSLDSIAAGLKRVATYDDAGLRLSLKNSFETFQTASSDMENKMSEAFDSARFDNIATLNAVSNLPFCGEKFVGADQKKQVEKEISKQERIMNFVKLDRCRQFVERNDLIAMKEETPASSSAPAPSTPVAPSGAPKTVAPKAPVAPKDPVEAEKAKVNKAILDVYNQDVIDCAAMIASPGVDTNDLLFKNGVDVDTNDMITPQIPTEVVEKLQGEGKKVSPAETTALNPTTTVAPKSSEAPKGTK